MLTFEQLILKLKAFWMQNGCTILEPIDIEVGAGTLAPYTSMNVLGEKPWNIFQIQYCRRPTDGRFGENPNRFSGYYQGQVLLKPAPENPQELCLQCLQEVGIDTNEHDIRFVEDDWENPSIGASGLGYEVWCDGMEIMQFTYMQRIGGIECSVVPCELTLGLERLAMYIQDKSHIKDIIWSEHDGKIKTYNDVNSVEKERQMCEYYQNYEGDTEFLRVLFEHYEKQSLALSEKKLYHPAYEMCLKASHTLNILDARGKLSQVERKEMILRVRLLAKACFESLI